MAAIQLQQKVNVNDKVGVVCLHDEYTDVVGDNDECYSTGMPLTVTSK